MIIERGNMWGVWGETDIFAITTNSYVNTRGCLVMGRGIAKQASFKMPWLPKAAGRKILDSCGHLGRYGLIVFKDQGVALFQVKTNWSLPASLALIHDSVTMLQEFCYQNPSYRIDLNFPGIGNGQLQAEDVKVVIEDLPDQVHVWQFEEPIVNHSQDWYESLNS